MVQGLPHIRVVPVDNNTEVRVQVKDLLRIDRADRLLIISCVQRVIILQAVPALGSDRQDILSFFEMDILPLPVKDLLHAGIDPGGFFLCLVGGDKMPVPGLPRADERMEAVLRKAVGLYQGVHGGAGLPATSAVCFGVYFLKGPVFRVPTEHPEALLALLYDDVMKFSHGSEPF